MEMMLEEAELGNYGQLNNDQLLKKDSAPWG
jgi:hypothetical protein